MVINKRKPRVKIEKETLYDLYVNNKMTTYTIGELFGLSNVTIGKKLKEFGISIRSKKECHKKFNISLDKFKKLYYIDKKTIKELMKIFGCSSAPICKLMRKHNLTGRKRNEDINISMDTLYNLYWIDNLTLKEIGKLFGISISRITAYFKKLNISRRTNSERNTGKNNPNYRNAKPHCEKCGKELASYKKGIKLCRPCHAENIIGENNPFYGKHHTKETVAIIADAHRKNGKPRCELCQKELPTYSKTVKVCWDCFVKTNIGENNKNFGKKVPYSVRIKISETNIKNGKLRGSNNPNYIDGRTPLSILIRKSFEYKEWKIKVFERDKYTCQECGKIGGYLEAHHINPFANILSDFLLKFNNFSPLEEKEILLRLSTLYEPFWCIQNGTTLCKLCHIKQRKDTISKIKKSGD